MARSAPGNANSIEEEDEDEPMAQFAASIIGPEMGAATTPPMSRSSSPPPPESATERDDDAEADAKPAALIKIPAPAAQPEIFPADSVPSIPRRESPPSVVDATDFPMMKGAPEAGPGEKSAGSSGGSAELAGEDSVPARKVSDADTVKETPSEQDEGPHGPDAPDASTLEEERDGTERQ
jgi:hypothetical protein